MTFAPRFDLVVVDEAQDIDPGWMGSLLPQIKENGRLYVMEDEDQRLAILLNDALIMSVHQ